MKNYWKIIMIFAIALILRVYATTSIPIDYDELYFIHLLDNTPVLAYKEFGPEWAKYYAGVLSLLKLERTILQLNGKELRLIFVFLSILSLLFTYMTVKENLGSHTAMLTLILLALSQVHIGYSRMISEYPLTLFFLSASMYTLMKFLHNKKYRWLYLTSLILGIGFAVHFLMLLVALSYLVFIITDKDTRELLKNPHLYFSFLATLALFLIHYFTSTKCIGIKIDTAVILRLGPSLRFIYLYFAECLAKLSEFTHILYWDIVNEKIFINTANTGMRLLGRISFEFPVADWLMGILIFLSVFFTLKYSKNRLLRFSLTMFITFLTVTSIISPIDFLDDFKWVVLSVLPGIIMSSHMLAELWKKTRVAKLIIMFICFYFFINALIFINIPENAFVGTKSSFSRYYLFKAEKYLREGRKQEAADRCRLLLKLATDQSIVSRAGEILDETAAQ